MSTTRTRSSRTKLQGGFDLALAARAIEVVPQVIREMRGEFRSSQTSELSVPQFRVLARMGQGAVTNKELAELVGLSVAATSRLVRQLETQGWVRKSTGLEDRREVRLELSPDGRRNYERISARARQGIARRFAQLSHSEKAKLELGFDVLARVFAGESAIGFAKGRS